VGALSGQQIGTVLGAAIGFYFGGPSGAQWGAAIGGTIGGWVDPTTVKGVQLGDLQAQPSVSGNPIAIVFGTNVAKGCRVICQSEVRVVTETDDGKGSGTEVENEVAYQDFTIEVCESSELRGTSVSAILVVWQDGQIVYDVRPDPLISNAESEKWKRGVTFYYGAEDQEPDPTEESYLGVGQIPAYRGKCRMVFDNRNISKYGNRIPNFECLVSSCATVVESGGGEESPYEFVSCGVSLYIAENADTWDKASPGVSADYVVTWGSRVLGLTQSLLRISDDYLDNVSSVASPWDSDPGTPNKPVKTASGRIYVTCGNSGATNENIYYTDDGGDNWTTVDVGFNCRKIAGSDSALIVQSGASTYRVATGGLTFGSDEALPGGVIAEIGYGDGMFMFARSGGPYYWSEDSGATLTPVTIPSVGGDVLEGYDLFRTSSGAWLTSNRVNSDHTSDVIARSPDGKQPFVYVTTPSGNTDGSVLNGFAERGGVIVSYLSHLSVPYYFYIKSSNDGIGWTRVDHGFTTTTARPSSIAAFDDDTGGTSIPDVPGYVVDPDTGEVTGPEYVGTPCATTAGYITQKVAEFCGIPDAEIVTTEIDGIAVRGYTIQSNVSGRGAIDPLCRTFFYDVPEFDGAIRCHVRGSVDVDSVIDTGEMLDLDSDEDEDQTRGQQVEYPRKHHLRYIASDVDYVFTDAIAERKSPDVRVVGETSIEAPVALTSDEAAKIADIQMKVVWTEREDIRKFGIPLENIELVGASILEVEDRRFRLDDYRIEDGAIFVERAAYDRVSGYSSNATGPVANPTNPPPSTLIGPTIGTAMNLPALRVEDDRLGLYFAGTGVLGGWRGYSIETATDVAGEYTVRNSAVLSRATIGVLTAALPAADRDYTDVANTLSVRLYAGELNSIEELAFHNGGNAAAILYVDGTAEIVNFRDAVETAPLEYDLTNLLRGRLDTEIAEHAVGAMFVLLNNALRFVDQTPADLGQTIVYRLASLGTTRADNASDAITVGTFESQREWSVTNLEAERDGSDNVTVTWDGRPALGTNVQPQHHAAFVGYQVAYSDGVDTFTKIVSRTPLVIVGGIVVTDETTTHTYTAAEQTTDFGSVPGSLDIEVSALNSLAGEGPATGTTV
jgi:hypothetical protein